jgi:wyosine [tRNA(Phe)-imidazoG37] synthetase (radical SAM superfamily)
LGVDTVPIKTCTLDCVYCQLGRTSQKTIQRKNFVDVEAVLTELKTKLKQGLYTNYITMGGSGEPTLNSQLGELIDGIRKITDIPVAILTNGTLFYRQDVRDDCAKANVVLPSLDAADEQTFQKINRPHGDISIEKLISGLSEFRNMFKGQIWLEVFLVEGFNTDDTQIAKLKLAIKRIRPDKIQLNTAIRPTAEKFIKIPDEQKLRDIAEMLGKNCEIVTDFPLILHTKQFKTEAKDVLSMLRRRPCSMDDICSSLNIDRQCAEKYLNQLLRQGFIESIEKGAITFFKALPSDS